ncbi:MAG TPA: hypothetical protein VF861_14760 [Telluria sp.]
MYRLRAHACAPCSRHPQALAACTDHAGIDVPGACTRIPVVLVPAVATAGVALLSDMEALAEFLDSGLLCLASDCSGQPAHEALLDRLLKTSGDELRTVLTGALAAPGSARRLVEHFPERQLLAVLRRMAGARAARFELLLEEAAQWPSGGAGRVPAATWVQVLTACTGGADALDADVARGRSTAPADPASDVASLAQFLDGGQLHIVAGDAQVPPAHEALLERLLAQGGETAWSALARALANPACARRLVEHFPRHQVHAVMRRLAPAQAMQLGLLLSRIALGR